MRKRREGKASFYTLWCISKRACNISEIQNTPWSVYCGILWYSVVEWASMATVPEPRGLTKTRGPGWWGILMNTLTFVMTGVVVAGGDKLTIHWPGHALHTNTYLVPIQQLDQVDTQHHTYSQKHILTAKTALQRAHTYCFKLHHKNLQQRA